MIISSGDTKIRVSAFKKQTGSRQPCKQSGDIQENIWETLNKETCQTRRFRERTRKEYLL